MTLPIASTENDTWRTRWKNRPCDADSLLECAADAKLRAVQTGAHPGDLSVFPENGASCVSQRARSGMAFSEAVAACATDDNPVLAVRSSRSTEPTDRELAFHHAPTHFQDTDDTHTIADYLARVDYDGTDATTDNWDNLRESADLRAAVYYSVVETCTHWHIVYAMYHPRDWADSFFDAEHENDLEGVLAFVEKDGSRFGKLQGVVPVAHRDFFSYLPGITVLADGHEDIDGILTNDLHDGTFRFQTLQEAKGHGLRALLDRNQLDRDGVIYRPGETGENPDPNKRWDEVTYELIDLFEPGGLWERQLREVEGGGSIFATWGSLRGNGSGGCGPICTSNAANMPWKWDDHDDNPPPGVMALDPARLVDDYFDNFPTRISHSYLRNRYLSDLQPIHTAGGNPQGWPGSLDLERLFRHMTTSCSGVTVPPAPELPCLEACERSRAECLASGIPRQECRNAFKACKAACSS